MTNYRELWQRLTPAYDEGEAKAVVRWLLEVAFGLSFADVVGGALERLSPEDSRRVEQAVQRIVQGEPVQYVAGRTEFCGHWFGVAPGVLIPRPETGELCHWCQEETREGAAILDIGTGSGCIAITLALAVARSQVTAWELSPEALGIARENALRHKVCINFVQQDALCPPPDTDRWDVIVSNPPYICRQEAADMEPNVLGHEPHMALFVPDDDPLRFYRAIAGYAAKALHRGGHLYFEINPRFAGELHTLLHGHGFTSIALREDQFGRRRMMKAEKA